MTSKSVWNLPGGPWERLFAGVWNNFNVAVYENAEKALLTTIFPKSGEVNWIMIRVDRILLFPSEFERIEPKLLEKRIHILKQHLANTRMTYVILLSPPTTVEFGSKEIGSEVLQKVMSLNEEVEEIKKIAKKANVGVVDLKDAPYKESASILGNPTILLSLLSIAPETEEPPKKEKLKEIVLGEEANEPFTVTGDLFETFISIKRGSEEERNYLAQAILENAIIDPSPITVIFDASRYPLKLEQNNPYPYDYSKYGLEGHNVGFKIKSYDLSSEKSEIRIDLNHASPQFIWKLFGLGKDKASSLILERINHLQSDKSLKDISSIEEDIKNVGETGGDRATTTRALRFMRAIKKAYGDIFSDSGKALPDIITTWVKNNDTVYISLARLGRRAKLAFTYYILDCMNTLRESKNISEIEKKRLEHIFPAFIDAGWLGDGIVQSEIVEYLITNHLGALFVSEGDLPMKIESRVSNRFQIIGPRRAKLYQGGRGKEFNIRPLLSCPP